MDAATIRSRAQPIPTTLETMKFGPSPERAKAFDTRMRARLAESLRHVVEECREKVPFDEAAMSKLISDVAGGGRVSPDVFATYYDLVRALLLGDQTNAEVLFADLAATDPIAADLTIITLGVSQMGAATFDRYRRMMDTDPQTPFLFIEPPADIARMRAAAIPRAIALLENADAILGAEFHSLIHQIVLAADDSVDGLSAYGGGSSLMLWGALFNNPVRPMSDLALVETLVHESAHSLLFGFAIDDPLVQNPDSERFPSPLRREARPMEGVFHAAYVSARIHYAMAALAESGLLDREGEMGAWRAMERSRNAFRDGNAVVEAHGRLTERGAAVLEAARNYMASSA